MESYIPSSELVPGDVLILAEGDNIAADAARDRRIWLADQQRDPDRGSHSRPENSGRLPPAGISELERPNLIFAGTSVASGTGRAVVVSTGMSTQFGRIAHLTQAIAEEPTPFQKELQHLSKFTAWVAAGIGAVVAVVGYFSLGFAPKEVILLSLGIVVAIIPEGLVATLTLSLAMAVQRLARRAC